MNGNFLGSLVQGIGNDVGRFFNPQQQQQAPQRQAPVSKGMSAMPMAMSPSMLPAMRNILPIATQMGPQGQPQQAGYTQTQPLAQQAPRQPQPMYTYQDGSQRATAGPHYIAPGTQGVNGMIFPQQPQPVRGVQPVPVGQPIPQQLMNSFDPQTKALAQIYQTNPRDPRVAHLDPAMFGYAADGPIQHTAGNPHGNNISTYRDGDINSISGRIGQYGGTIGSDSNGRQFGSINHNGQQIDPIAALRGLLGL